jgi:hypothetical protein
MTTVKKKRYMHECLYKTEATLYMGNMAENIDREKGSGKTAQPTVWCQMMGSACS